MIATMSTLLFAAAASAAVAVIFSTLRSYGADVRALKLQLKRVDVRQSIAWRIVVEPTAHVLFDGLGTAKGVRESLPARHCPPSLPEHASLWPSLAA